MASAGNKVVFLIEDGPFHFDNRVRREVAALAEVGYECAVISPSPTTDPRHSLPSAEVRTYRPVLHGGHLGEYVHALWAQGRLLKRLVREWGVPEVIHAANPPDLLYLVALPYIRRYGAKFVFDQHDLCPELYASRYPSRTRGPAMWGLLYFERAAYRVADHVIVTNESYRRIAQERGGLPPERVTVVRNGPEHERFRVEASIKVEIPPGRRWIGYLGNMNPQDGVEYLIRATAWLVRDAGVSDVHAVLVGQGDAVPALKHLAQNLGVGNHVTFLGRLPDAEMVAVLRRCAVCVQPDPKNPLNDVSTMNKVMEYMALGRPVVAFDLTETRVTCGDCARYAESNNWQSLGAAIRFLLDHPDEAERLGRAGEQRVWAALSWDRQKEQLLAVYEALRS